MNNIDFLLTEADLSVTWQLPVTIFEWFINLYACHTMVILDVHPHVELCSGPMPGFSQFELRRIRHSLFFYLCCFLCTGEMDKQENTLWYGKWRRYIILIELKKPDHSALFAVRPLQVSEAQPDQSALQSNSAKRYRSASLRNANHSTLQKRRRLP